MDALYSDSDLDMMGLGPPVPPATRNEPAAEPGAGARGRVEGNRPTPSVTLEMANFGDTNGSSISSSNSSSDDSSISSDDLSTLVGRSARDLDVFD